MKFSLKPEHTYIVVFCFFALGAGCKAAGEYAYERYEARAQGTASLEQNASPGQTAGHSQALEQSLP